MKHEAMRGRLIAVERLMGRRLAFCSFLTNNRGEERHKQ